MRRAPEILSTGEVRQQPEIIAARWDTGTINLAELVNPDGDKTDYRVGGPITAGMFASYSLRAGLAFEDYAVLPTKMPWPLLATRQLRELGYLVVARSEEPDSALLVILGRQWVEWKTDTDKKLIQAALRIGLRPA